MKENSLTDEEVNKRKFAVLIVFGLVVMVLGTFIMWTTFHAGKEMKPTVPSAVPYGSVQTGVVVNVVVMNGMSVLTATIGVSVNHSKQYPQVSSGIEQSYTGAVSANTNLVVGDRVIITPWAWMGQLTVGSPDCRIATKL